MNSAEARSAEDALSYLRDHAPEVRLVFTKVDLPGRRDGIDVARIALLGSPWIKVLVASGEVCIRDVPQNVVLLPKVWHAANIRAHLSLEVGRGHGS